MKKFIFVMVALLVVSSAYGKSKPKRKSAPPPETQGYLIEVPSAQAPKVKPGDQVDVHITYDDGSADSAQTFEFKRVNVLSTEYPDPGSNRARGYKRGVSPLTLDAPQDLSDKLMKASRIPNSQVAVSM